MTDSAKEYEDLSDEIAEIASQMKSEWLKFANLYVEMRVGYKAYREAYSAPEMPMHSAASCSSKLLRKPLMAKYVRLVKQHLAKQNLVSLEEIQEHLQNQAFANMAEFIGWEIVEEYDDDGEVVSSTPVPKVKVSSEDLPPEIGAMIKGVTFTKNGPAFALQDQHKALDMLIKMRGGYAPEKKEITGNGGGALEMVITDLSTDELESELKSLGIDDESNRGE